MSYIKPADCISPKAQWNLISVLDDRGPEDISLALGKWANESVLAVRWNGKDDAPLGNPQSRGIPTWFVLPRDYADLIISTLPKTQQPLVAALMPPA